MSIALPNDDLLARAAAEITESDIVLERIRPKTQRVRPEDIARLREECAAQAEAQAQRPRSFARRLFAVAVAAFMTAGHEAARR